MSAFADAIARVQDADRQLNDASPTPFPLPVVGLEAVVVGTVLALDSGDWWLPGLRERVGAVLRDTPLARLRDGHSGAKPYRVAPPNTSPALRALYAVGLGLDGFAAVHLGIGSAADGAFYEALNLAALRKSHVAFVVAVHPLSGDDAPLGPQLATQPSSVAMAFGIPAVVVDGNDPEAVHAAVSTARSQEGPHLIEARLTPRSGPVGTDKE
jgi:TPP-dependent pyruvate/acetoin dehydrogenase alpha subunit